MASEDRPPIWVRWYAKDALDGMFALSPVEELAYRRILDMIFTTGDKLLDDDRAMAWMTKAGRQWKTVKKRLLDLGKITVEDGFVRNKRASIACTESRDFVAQKIAAANAGVEARKALKNNNRTPADAQPDAGAGVAAGGSANQHSLEEERERESPLPESVPSPREARRGDSRRILLRRMASAAAWRKFADCESEAKGPMARTRPCIRARDGIPGVDPDIQKYPLDDWNGLPEDIFENTLIACREDDVIDWTPLFEWVHAGVSRETILEAIEVANAGYRDRLERYPSRTTPPRGLGFYDRTVRRLAGLLAADEEEAA